MGAQSDFISEQFAPSERYKAQQRLMAETIAAASPEETVHMNKPKPQPHLIDYQGAQHCSICKMPFPPDAKPSQDEAFAEHAVRGRRPGQTSEDFSHAAVRVVREATEC
jgi:hypothetical protein